VKFSPLIDSAENFRTPGLNCQDDFAGQGVIDGVTPPSISGLVDFVEQMAATLD
jgi:hypothetical protein